VQQLLQLLLLVQLLLLLHLWLPPAANCASSLHISRCSRREARLLQTESACSKTVVHSVTPAISSMSPVLLRQAAEDVCNGWLQALHPLVENAYPLADNLQGHTQVVAGAAPRVTSCLPCELTSLTLCDAVA
jgi:hypothetical protein